MMLLEGKAELDTLEPLFCKMGHGLPQTLFLFLFFRVMGWTGAWICLSHGV